MAIPKITINLLSGQTGAVGATNDGICGLVIGCDPGSSGITAGDMFALRSLDDAKTNNIDQIAYAYQQIKEFYDEAPIGTLLYVMIVANTVTLEDMADKTKAYGKTLLDYANGDIKMLGVCRKPAGAYTPTVTHGLDEDCLEALITMQAMAEDYHAAFKPFVGIVEGRSYQGVPANLTDLTTKDYNFVACPLGMSTDMKAIDAAASSIGLLMGRAAAIPVQRKVSRVKDGALSASGMWYGHSTTPTDVAATDFTSIDAKGYLAVMTFAGKSGYFYADDLLATATTDDYKTIGLRRVMNKIVRLVYVSYINELNDDIALDAEGKIAAPIAKYYEGLIENAVNNTMTSADEISSFTAYVDTDQNVLSTGKIQVRCICIPKGYSQEIVVTLGFDNPQI